MPVEPKDAATLILLRRCEPAHGEAFEVLMVRRNEDQKFAPGAYVFPGGTLDPGDYGPAAENMCAGLDRKTAEGMLDEIRYPGRVLGFWVAALRETFEEVGLLMAYNEKRCLISCDSVAMAARFSGYRRNLLAGTVTFPAILEAEGLTLATDRLRYMAHWITPEILPIRFDVRFFVAEAPPGQHAIHHDGELLEHEWIGPKEALARYEKGHFPMVLPTLVTVEELAKYGSLEDVLTSTEEKKVEGILTRLQIDEDEGIVEYFPDGSARKNLAASVPSVEKRKRF